MLQYLVILLSDESTSYCYLPHPLLKRGTVMDMPLETLHKGIRYAMTENLMIQFVYPEKELSEEIKKEIETIDHSKIKAFSNNSDERAKEADVIVLNNWSGINGHYDVPVVLRTGKTELFERYKELYGLLESTPRLNVVITDVEKFTSDDFDTYKHVLTELSAVVEKLYVEGKSPQLNLLTDRMMLDKMNNCGAGDTTITLAPNGKFYVCPAFYYDNENDSIGDLEHGLDIKNKQLYKLEFAPICRHCDSYQCKRCVWLNRKTTLEVNTPSHEQCVVAHLERNASRELLANIRKHGSFLPDREEIKEIDYLDPFDKHDEW